jgi:hypothetical protein
MPISVSTKKKKSKSIQVHAMLALRGRGGILLLVHDFGARWGEWSASRPGERTHGSHWVGDWVGPRAGLDVEAKREIVCLCQTSNPGRPARSQSCRSVNFIETSFHFIWSKYKTAVLSSYLTCIWNLKVIKTGTFGAAHRVQFQNLVGSKHRRWPRDWHVWCTVMFWCDAVSTEASYLHFPLASTHRTPLLSG